MTNRTTNPAMYTATQIENGRDWLLDIQYPNAENLTAVEILRAIKANCENGLNGFDFGE